VRGIERKLPYILPNFDARATFMLCDGLGGIIRWYCDLTIAKARRERET
jgi:hypothetical protein